MAITAVIIAVFSAFADDRFVNFESPQVHPLDIGPGGTYLAACNTANGTVDVFALGEGMPMLRCSVPVGIDPASVRFRTETEIWVTNWLSDSISIVDIARGTVAQTLQTRDEPADVIFTKERAFVTCSQAGTLLIFELGQLDAPPKALKLHAKFPRALALSEDGARVYVATFQSGNKTTALAHDYVDALSPMAPERVLSRPDGPHGGQNPPFNGDGVFVPPLAAGLPPPPPVDLIVKQQGDSTWRDDTGADWSRFVSGEDANAAGRVRGWTLPDHDVSVVDAETLDISYISGLMNICMGIAVRPSGGEISIIGTDAINEIRYEPNVAGKFLSSLISFAGKSGSARRVDLNPHLDYKSIRVEQALRDMSVGDPRAIVWEPDGAHAWVAGMGSNNVVRIDANGARVGDPVPVSPGPTGLVLDAARGKLHVLCRFAASIDTIDLATASVAHRQSMYDPTPSAIREGRPFLYDAHATSGLGQASCGGCHVDAKTDGLAWDLGDPQGAYKTSERRNLSRELPPSAADDYHPMKGPRTTQTLQDIIGHEPFHWSGDRDNLEAFSGAFATLLGADTPLAPAEMAKLKSFLATISFPPNPFRNLDNSLPENLPMDGMLAPAAPNEPRGPMPNGNARRGLDVFLSEATDCSRCHTLPSGRGSHLKLENGQLKPTPVGADGTVSLRVVSGANTKIQTTRKPAQFFGFYAKTGMDSLSVDGSTTGFGMLSAGAFDSLPRFLLTAAPHIGNLNLQQSADVTALLLSWGGSEFPAAPSGAATQPPGLPGRDAHAALGAQVTLNTPTDTAGRLAALSSIVAASPRLELVAHGNRNGKPRGWWLHEGRFEADAPGEYSDLRGLVASSGPESETTFTVVAAGTGKRLGIDRDLDGTPNAVDTALDPVALNPMPSDADLMNCATCEDSGLNLSEGDTLCLHVDVPGGSSFMWSLRDKVFSDFQSVRGATTDRFQMANVSAADRGMYRVDYIDAAGAPANRFFVVEVTLRRSVWLWPSLGLAALLATVALIVFRRRRA